MPETTTKTNPVLNPVVTLCPTLCSVRELVAAAVVAGITVRVEGDTVRARGPKHARAIGDGIINRKIEVLAFLTTWNAEDATAIQEMTDGEFARLGVSGFDAEVRTAAADGVRAHHGRDLAGVVDACRRLLVRAHALADAREAA